MTFMERVREMWLRNKDQMFRIQFVGGGFRSKLHEVGDDFVVVDDPLTPSIKEITINTANIVHIYKVEGV